jgi:hypothetical protein
MDCLTEPLPPPYDAVNATVAHVALPDGRCEEDSFVSVSLREFVLSDDGTPSQVTDSGKCL